MLFNKRLLQNYLNNFDLPKDYDFRRVQKFLATGKNQSKMGITIKPKKPEFNQHF